MQGPHRRRGVVWGGVYGGQTAVRTLRFLITTRIGTRRTEIMETIATGGIHPTLLGMRSVVCFCGDSGRGRPRAEVVPKVGLEPTTPRL
jgi:hypothetical protein